MIKGIDISEHQERIDFQRVKAAGIQFVIPREGYRKKIDSRLLEYARKAKEAGIALLGVYHFIYTDGATIAENAQSTLTNLKRAGLDPTNTWIFADIEKDTWDKNGEECTKSRCTKYVKDYLDELTRAGCKKLGIYTNNDYYQNYLDWNKLPEYKGKVWLADYSDGPDQPCIIQQTAESGRVDGITGTVDTDLLIDERIADGLIEITAGVTADDVLAVYRSWIGISKSNLTHKPILKIYNDYILGHPGAGRGYIVKDDDQYCDTGFSAAFIKLNAVDLIGGVECGVEEHVKIFKAAGIWEEDGSKTPEKGWGIVYNWDDTTQPNDGYSDHIGIVYDVVDGQIYCYECNMNGGKVGIRRIPVGYGCIRGFCKPKYAQVSEDVEISDGTAPAVFHNTVKRGSKGADVRTLQEKLVMLGYTLDCDGDFGSQTEKAVKGFQKLYGLEADGIVGPATWTKLDELTELSKEPKWVGSITLPPLPVRSAPSESAELLPDWPYLGHGNLVDVCSEIGDWCYIRIAGKYFGYIPAENVKAACGDACEITG